MAASSSIIISKPSVLLTEPLSLLIALGVLFLIGIIIIVVLKTFIILIPAIIVAGIVWWLTGSEILTGIAFLLIALTSFAKK